PDMAAPQPLASALSGAALATPSGDPPTLARPCILVGPEGGWTPAEEALGLPRVRLGPGILRTETAAIAAAVLLAALRDGVVEQRASRADFHHSS
ncbi:MAG: 16S rRNA (uracil(1498)-N(3))-methyltransferase, partial [Acidimicrobiaceae bacterium]|nr:16S rRNA (uracil(1498)-N(3))-methyltransferase [Acidimicrobiaceae bacterium]